jgi:phosphoglycolate phosphatase-like HAD superfamily hydrolase
MNDNVTGQLAQLSPDSTTPDDLALVQRHAPRVRFDRHEPFLPLAVGYTVFRTPGESPSFRREIAFGDGVATVIEYAIWWDWDIQHLYELEHVWVHLDAVDQIVAVEASAHGQLIMMTRDDGSLPVDTNGRVELYAEPGKHAFTPSESWLHNLAEDSRLRCGERAGSGGVLVNDMFRAQLGPLSETDHRLARRWLQRRRFDPAFTFDQVVDLRSVALAPWLILYTWIPGRVHEWIDLLRKKPHIKAICLDCGDTLVDEGTEIKDENGVVLRADLIPGADDLIHELKRLGYMLALVADGPRGTFETVLAQHGLYDSFDAFAISGDVGVSKPAPVMFHTALRALAIPESDYSQVIMVGNNLPRDIKGANDLSMISVWLDWSPRRSKIPADSSEMPHYTIKQPLDLLAVLEQIEIALLGGLI